MSLFPCDKLSQFVLRLKIQCRFRSKLSKLADTENTDTENTDTDNTDRENTDTENADTENI